MLGVGHVAYQVSNVENEKNVKAWFVNSACHKRKLAPRRLFQAFTHPINTRPHLPFGSRTGVFSLLSLH